jgi:hypothetical protein
MKMNKKQIAKNIKTEVAEIRKIINEWDPLPGTPEDEFDYFVHHIVSVLHNKVASKNDIELLIKREMIVETDAIEVEEVANKIWKYWINLNK